MTALTFILLCLHFFTDVLKGAGPGLALIFCGVSLFIQFGFLVYRVITSDEDDLYQFIRNPPEPWKYTTIDEQKDHQEVYDALLMKYRTDILTEQMEERKKRNDPVANAEA